MKARLALVALLAGPACAADVPLPWLYDVTGVSAGDVLNVREVPGAGSRVIGRLEPDARGIEVVARDATGRWGQINAGERAGWAAMRYLAPQAGGWEAGTLPAGLRCFGTEPFWLLEPGPGAVVFGTPDRGEQRLELRTALDTGIAGDPRRALIAESAGERLSATIVPRTCTDGMSDRSYGLDVTLILEDTGAPRLLTGCCSIAR